MKDKLSNLLTGFRKNHNTQHCLISMLERWEKNLDERGIDLSKAFDALNHKLLISKLEAYGFDTKALYYIKSYLDNRKQRARVNSNFSSWQEIIAGVSQGSILVLILFNIFVNDFFLFVSSSNLTNYADDNTLYTSDYNLKEVKEVLLNHLVTKWLQNGYKMTTEWFFENYMVLNAAKCLFMCLGKNTENETFTFKNTIMNNSKEEKILGVIINNRQTFSSHITELCKKASQKISALSRISNQLNDSEKNLLFIAVVKSQFNYCPLVWIFCSKTSSNMINRVYERALKVILSDDLSDFKSLSQNNRNIGNHHKNILSLMIEMFKTKNKLAPPIMDSMFERRNEPYNLRNFQ